MVLTKLLFDVFFELSNLFHKDEHNFLVDLQKLEFKYALVLLCIFRLELDRQKMLLMLIVYKIIEIHKINFYYVQYAYLFLLLQKQPLLIQDIPFDLLVQKEIMVIDFRHDNLEQQEHLRLSLFFSINFCFPLK